MNQVIYHQSFFITSVSYINICSASANGLQSSVRAHPANRWGSNQFSLPITCKLLAPCAGCSAKLQRAAAFPLSYLVCIRVGVVEGGRHGRGREWVLSSGEGGGRRLNQRRRVTEGTQTPLLGQELLVRYWVDVGGEAE